MPFVKGQSGNPAGRPKGTHPPVVTPSLRHILSEPGPGGKPWAHAIADRLVGMAAAGNIEAIKVVFDRMDGRVPQPISGDPDNPAPVFTFTIQRAGGGSDGD